MGKLTGALQITGKLEGLSMYKMHGSDDIIVRRKGGPSKKQIKESPNFGLTRRNNAEFGGRSKMASHVRQVLFPLRNLADHNYTGHLNALFKHIQKQDAANAWGQRGVLLSQHQDLLINFNLNKRFLFDSLVRTPLTHTVHKDVLEGTVHVPSLLPGINFAPAGKQPWFRITASLGVVPDLVYTPHGYMPVGGKELFGTVTADTDWQEVSAGLPAMDLQLKISKTPNTPQFSLVLGIGFAMGDMEYGAIRAVKYVGGAKVLAVV